MAMFAHDHGGEIIASVVIRSSPLGFERLRGEAQDEIRVQVGRAVLLPNRLTCSPLAST